MTIDFSGIDTSSVKILVKFMSELNAKIKTLIIRNLNTPNLLTTKYMFSGNRNIKFIDLGVIDTTNWSNAYGMFKGCSSLERVIMHSTDTWRLLDTGEMFNGCEKLVDVDLVSIIPDGSSIINMVYMFNNCESLDYLDLYTMNINIHTATCRAFYHCYKLFDNMDNLGKPSNQFSSSIITAKILEDSIDE